MRSGEGTPTTPQFETAEFARKPGVDTCFVCHQPISGSYFRVNTQMACGPCTDRLKNSIPQDSHSAFVRALTFGAGAAVAGLIVYAVIGIVTGLMIGYVSLAVGWMVGKAMMKGSGGLGGRRYQIAAVLFTYAAVSVAAIPIGIAEFVKEKKPAAQSQAPSQTPSANASGSTAVQENTLTPSAHRENGSWDKHGGLVFALGYLAAMGLASPFLELGSDPFHGLIGLVILLVGVRIAWQITRGLPPLVVDGPLQN